MTAKKHTRNLLDLRSSSTKEGHFEPQRQQGQLTAFLSETALAYFSFLMTSVATVAVALLLPSCGTNKESGEGSFNIIPDSQMNRLGAQAFEDIKNSTPVSTDTEMVNKITEIGRRVAAASGADFDWEFVLFEQPDINAFCLPGGKIGVYRGILEVAKNNAGLAAIMGHEVAHATLRHGAERLSNSVLAQVGFTILAIGLDDSPYRDEILAAMGIGYTVGVELAFGRDQESDSDRVGLRYMARAGYDPQEAVGLWQRMAEASNARVPEFFSTHPDPGNRAEVLQELQGTVQAEYETAEKVQTADL